MTKQTYNFASWAIALGAIAFCGYLLMDGKSGQAKKNGLETAEVSASKSASATGSISTVPQQPVLVPAGTVLPAKLDPFSNLGIVLGPATGGLVPLLQARAMLPDKQSSEKVAPVDFIMTAMTPEEALWMDQHNFPTHEELQKVPYQQVENAFDHEKGGMRSLRAMAVKMMHDCLSARWELCEDQGAQLASLGEPVGSRAVVVKNYHFYERSAQSSSKEESARLKAQYEQRIAQHLMLGSMLGDRFSAYSALFHSKVISINQLAGLANENSYQISTLIPKYRAVHGLPPLQIVRQPPNRFLVDH
jgi:hypothetical protein